MLDVVNPRTGRVDFRIDSHQAPFVEARAAELREGQSAWRAMGIEGRSEVLNTWADALLDHRDAIVSALTVDTGRHLMAHFEATGAIERIRYLTERAPGILSAVRDGSSELVPSVDYKYRLVPFPLVGVISPWNVPLTLALIDAVPALLAGAAVLLKPSEVTPRFADPLMTSVAGVPELASVFGVVTGGAATGVALIDNVDAICFTGSVETGRKVAAHAAGRFIPAFLELGGKDPAVVLSSADLDSAATAILRSAAGLSGQACQSLERIYVHRSVFDEFLNVLVAKAGAVQINWPDIHQGHIGPFIFPPQADKVADQIADARARGARILTGGEVTEHDGGRYCLPTVIVEVTPDMKLMREETFGPLLPVIPFDSTERSDKHGQ